MSHAVMVAARPQAYIDVDGTPPGAFKIAADGRGMFFQCPCGCGQACHIDLNTGGHPAWAWDGNRERPTLTPSIRQVGGCRWHGFLTAGVWRPCGDSGQ